ncbi:hypothetical protein B7P43_G17443 [Cryptotermes secundus]|uniref:Reverse transcriptase domain-containing protein n=1 Tax=Cryptotermes secundus TaxID=105785 RepID=A0A2J7R4B5_9NEOP|nr:hypothetical protein B7P43_G17443 [Cryptotermes secundus]
MATRVHRPLKVIAFNANGIGRQRYELSKQLQDLHVDVALFSETHLKPHERFFIPNYYFYRIDRQSGRNGGTAVAVRKGIPHNHVDLPPLVSVEATGVCIPIGLKLMDLFDMGDFEISAPQCPTHYSPAGNGDVLDIVVHKNIRMSEVVVSDILDSDHLPIVFHILDHVKISNLSEPIEKFTDWERLSTSKVTLSDINNDLPGLDRLIKYKQRLRKLWQETRDPACKTAVNWVTKSIRRMTRKKALERWETKISNAEVTPQCIWPIAKSLLKRDGPRAPTAIHGSSGLKFHPSEKANEIADCLEIQFTPHDLCDENHEQRVEARVQALLEAVDENPPLRIRPCDVQKLIKSLKLKKACGIDGIPNECLRHLPRRPLVHLTHLFNHCFRLSHFPNTWKEAKIITLPKPGKDPKFPQNLRPISLLSTTGKLFEKAILKFLHKHIEERDLLNASQFGFRARHSTTLQCMRLADHVTLNFNNKMSTAAVFLDIEKAFDTTWHSGLLFKLSKLEFPNSLTKLIGSFLSKRKFRVSVEGEMSTPREMQAGVPQGSVLSPTLFNMYILMPLKLTVFIWPSLRTTPVYMRQIAKRVLLLENSSAVSAQWRPGVSAGI